LSRLVESGELDRVAPGIFVRPQIDRIIGKITPTIEDITKAISQKRQGKDCSDRRLRLKINIFSELASRKALPPVEYI